MTFVPYSYCIRIRLLHYQIEGNGSKTTLIMRYGNLESRYIELRNSGFLNDVNQPTLKAEFVIFIVRLLRGRRTFWC